MSAALKNLSMTAKEVKVTTHREQQTKLLTELTATCFCPSPYSLQCLEKPSLKVMKKFSEKI